MSRSDERDSIRPRSSMFDSLAPAALAVTMAGTVGCSLSQPPESMVARGEAIDRTTQALAVGALKALEGVYGEGCVERSGSWSLALEGDAKLEAPPLSVVKDDSACELSIRAVIADERIELVAPLVLQEDYASKPAQVGNDKATFFINAKISSSKMTDSFKVTVLYSDDPRAVADSYGASYATVAASGSMETVVAPDYKIDFAGGGLKVLVNAKSVVSSAEGSAATHAQEEDESGKIEQERAEKAGAGDDDDDDAAS